MPEIGLAERFAALVPRMREETKRALREFFDGADDETGGTVVMSAPCKSKKRDLPEAAFRSERWNELLA